MAPYSKLNRKKNHQNISWSKLIYEDRSLQSLAHGRNVMQARQYFKFELITCLLWYVKQEANKTYRVSYWLAIGQCFNEQLFFKENGSFLSYLSLESLSYLNLWEHFMIKLQGAIDIERSEFAQQTNLHNSFVTVAKSLKVWSHYGEGN